MLSRSILLAATGAGVGVGIIMLLLLAGVLGSIAGILVGNEIDSPWLHEIEMTALGAVGGAGIIVLLLVALVWWQTRNLDEHGEKR